MLRPVGYVTTYVYEGLTSGPRRRERTERARPAGEAPAVPGAEGSGPGALGVGYRTTLTYDLGGTPITRPSYRHRSEPAAGAEGAEEPPGR